MNNPFSNYLHIPHCGRFLISLRRAMAGQAKAATFLALLLLTLQTLHAQVPPPNLNRDNIPPPPSYRPPAPPPGIQPRLPEEIDNPQPATSNQPPATSHQPPATSNPQPATSNQPITDQQIPESSALTEDDDPRMRETVGLIRIPDMGTNEVLEMLENFTAKPILRQQSLPAVKISFFSQGPLTRGEAIRAIESLLSLNGIAITPLGEKFLKAVPSAIINAQGAPIWTGSTLNAIPSQKIYEKIFQLHFLTAQETVSMIQPLMSQGAPIAFDKSGFLLVTDALVNLQRIERILGVIDLPPELKVSMLFFELENIGAQDALRRLQQIQTGPLKRQLENNTSFDADERTNQLVIFTHPSNEKLMRELIGKLDVNVAPMTATKVYSIRYAEAPKVVEIIEQIVTGQKEVRDQSAGGNAQGNAARQAAIARRTQAANQTAAAARAEAANLQFSDFLTIVADERANTIVASGTQNDLRFLEKLIEEIDSLLAQVRIEVVITEVRLTDGDTRGIDSFDFRYNVSTPAGDNPPTFNTTGHQDQKYGIPGGNFYGASIPGVTWGPDGFGIQAVLSAVRTNSNVTVLSAPTIVTTHNKEAIVSVGEQRPVRVGSTTSGSSDFVTDNIQFKDIKLELKVTPLIGIDGVIQMEIDQSIQSLVDNIEINGNDQPVIGTRQATSYVSVRDQELIVLGGLQSLDRIRNNGRMAILGAIPVLGDWLFTRKSESNTRTELLIFIRPTIIRDTAAANLDANQMIDKLDASKDIRAFLDDGTFRNSGKKEEKEEQSDETRELPRRNRP